MKLASSFVIVKVVVFYTICVSDALLPEKKEGDDRPFCACDSNQGMGIRIVGGRDALRGQFPYAAGLVSTKQFRSSGYRDFSSFCGASLITDRHVLTAAHCLRDRKEEDINVDVGEYDLSQNEPNMREVSSLIKHPEYQKIGWKNDIAIIELDEPVELNQNLRTVWLPPPNYELDEGTTLTVYGWGRLEYTGDRPKVLQTVELPVASYEQCQKVYVTKIYGDMMICAGGDGGKDACIGDSGSGLLARMENEYVIVGTVSFGKKCGLPHVPGIYSNVSSYVHWIYENTKSAACQPCIVSPFNFQKRMSLDTLRQHIKSPAAV